MHKSQILLYFILAFIVGIFVGSFVDLPPVLTVIFISLGGLVIVLFWPGIMESRRNRHSGNWLFVIIAFCVIIFVFGISYVTTFKSKHSIISEFGDRKISITLNGYVDGEPAIEGDNQKIIFRAKELVVPKYLFMMNEKVLVTVTSYPRLHYGEMLQLNGEIELPKIISSTGFDYKSYLAKDGISALMYHPRVSTKELQLSAIEKSKLYLFSEIFRVKNTFETSVQRAVVEPNASFLNGILLGSRGNIPDDLKEAFSRTGMTHVLAISGYNIAIVAEIVSLFLLFFFRRSTAFWVTVGAIIIFTILTGASSSVMRAAVMGILVLLARREGRLYRVHNAIAVAAALMLFFNPLALRYDVGFQLSFLATLGLVFLSPRLERYFVRWPEKFKLKETMLMSLSAQVFVLPLLVYQFGSISLTSLPANLLVLPTMPYAMLLGFLTGIGGIIVPVLGQVIDYFAWFLTSVELGIIRTLAEFSWSSIQVDVGWWVLIVGYVVLLGVLFQKNIRNIKNIIS